jgi:cytochrome c oxidase subunit 2
MKKTKTTLLVFASIVVLLLISRYSFADDPVPTEATLTTSRPDAAQSVEVKITAKKFSFDPNKISVSKGDTVRLIVTSVDVDHGIGISEFGIDRKVKKGATEVIEFVADKEGKFVFFCSVFCGDGHPDMTGELLVTNKTTTTANSSSAVKVSFDPNAPGVAYVEMNGERLRIDTNAKTYSRVESKETAPAKKASEAQVLVSEKERKPHWTSEPYDYQLINVPTPKRVPKHSLNLHFAHRFSDPINDNGAQELFGLDSFSVSSFGFSYGFTDRIYGKVYRSPICTGSGLCKTIELGLGFHLLDEAGKSPIAMSAYTSVEGDSNFTENYTFNIQAMFARSITKYVNLVFSPAVHLNSNGNGRFNPAPVNFPGAEKIAQDFKLDQHTGSFGFGVNARIRPSTSLLFEYTPRIGFKQGRVDPIFDKNFNVIGFRNISEAEIGFGIEKRIGRHAFSLTFSNTQGTTTSRYNSSTFALPPSKLIIGFNLFRRLL